MERRSFFKKFFIGVIAVLFGYTVSKEEGKLILNLDGSARNKDENISTNRFGDLSQFKARGNGIVDKIKNEFSDREINLLWYANGDGSDETNKFQKCINEAPPYSTIYIPQGYEFIVTSIKIIKPLKLTGNGLIKLKEGEKNTPIYVNGTNKVVFDSIRIDGSKDSQIINSTYDKYLIQINNSMDCVITGCTLENAAGDGIMLSGGSTNCIITYNTIRNIFKNGIRVVDPNTNDNLIHGNYINNGLNSSQNSIYLNTNNAGNATQEWMYRNIVTENRCINSGDVGIEIGQRNSNAIVSNNIICNPRYIGILVRDNQYTRIHNNQINMERRKNSYYGIAIWTQKSPVGESKVIVDSNTVLNSVQHGIYINDGNSISIKNNEINKVDTGYAGIYFFKDYHEIKNNKIYNVDIGIQSGDNGKFITVENNKIIKCNMGIDLSKKILVGWNINNNFFKLNEPLKIAINATEATAQNSFCYNNKLMNKINSSHLNFRNINIFVQNSHGEWGMSVPKIKGEELIIAQYNDCGIVSIQFGEEFVLFSVFPQSGFGDGTGYSILSSSDNVKGNTKGSFGWGITKREDGYIVLKRLGENINNDLAFKKMTIKV